MTNNDVLRRLRYTFNFNDNKMIAIFASAELEVSREQVSNWLKKEDDSQHVNCTDTQLAVFLNGLINEKRGKKEGKQATPEKRINNNIILTKLKIALNLKAEDILEILSKENLQVSKSELSAFFRKPEHKHYRQCKDQFLRNVLQGIEKLYFVKRPDKYLKKNTGIPGTSANSDTADKPKQSNYKTASAAASKIYVNPNKSKTEKPSSGRKVLKLKPEDIYKQ